MYLKILPKKELSPHFQNTGFCDLWQHYDDLNVAIDPNIS